MFNSLETSFAFSDHEVIDFLHDNLTRVQRIDGLYLVYQTLGVASMLEDLAPTISVTFQLE